jgi:3-hydroxyacyl-[acyl-carrier-protein] dehydratase
VDTAVTTMDISEVMRFLPHRFPFLMIDRVIEIKKGESLVALKNVTVNEPCFTGHFPGEPIMPGVLILEALAQAAGILAYCSFGYSPKEALYLLGSIQNARFKQVVRPGDQLLLHITFTASRANFCKVEAKATVDGQIVCTADIMSARKDIQS